MFITELIREFLFDCNVRELSDLTVKNYEKQLQKFRHFVREDFQVIQFEELKPIHVKEYISDLQNKGCKKNLIIVQGKYSFRFSCVEQKKDI